ncbi:MAG: hypothetical protein RLY21_494 [Planctomycetota bacterium]
MPAPIQPMAGCVEGFEVSGEDMAARIAGGQVEARAARTKLDDSALLEVVAPIWAVDQRVECSRFALESPTLEHATHPVGFEHSPAQPANVRNPKTRPKAADSRRGTQCYDATLSANKKPVLAEGDHGFFESGEGGIRTHE